MDSSVSSAETLLFLHIPKTAGTSLVLALLRQLPPDAVYQVRRGNNRILARRHGSEEELRALPAEDRARLRLVFGHFKFGLHRHLPGRPVYITVLRDPVERTLSNLAHFNRERKVLRGEAAVSFDELCRARGFLSDNTQTRLLCGGGFEKRPGEESLALAEENLRSCFRVVGTTERLDETLLLIEKTFGWPRLRHYHKNTTPVRPGAGEVDAETLASIRSRTELDASLYQLANQLLSDAIGRLGSSSFQLELENRRRRARAFHRVLARTLETTARGALDRVRFLVSRLRTRVSRRRGEGG